MPDLIRHPEGLKRTGFRLEFIPMKIGAGMTILTEAAIYKQTLNRSASFLPPNIFKKDLTSVF